MKIENIKFLIGFCVSAIAAWLLSLTGIWQLVLIAGFIGGLSNGSMKRGGLSSATGVVVAWSLIMLVKSLTQNAIALLNAFIGLLGLTTGWILYPIVILLGFIFGLLGGMLGGGVYSLIIKPNIPKNEETKKEIDKPIP